MQDIFISKLATLLDDWSDAFPEASLLNNPTALTANTVHVDENAAQKIFCLHLNQDTQASNQTSALASNQASNLDTIALILKTYPAAKIVVLANVPNQAEAVHALSLGAMGYCHAYTAADILQEIKAVVSHGGLWIGQDMLQRLIAVSTKLMTSQPKYVENLLEKLTPREQEVALEAAKGATNKEIARKLAITERTVKAHLAKVFERLGARDRLQLALMLNDNVKH